jgi:hypothetical protein
MGVYNFTPFHPRVIAIVALEAELGVLAMLTVLVIAYRFLGVAHVSASIADWGDNEPFLSRRQIVSRLILYFCR